jgi:acylpyruvate hydrolase
MKLATFLAPGADAPQAGEVRGEAVVAFAGQTTVLDRLTSGDRTPATGAEHPLAGVRLLAPVPRPRAIFGVGLNYAAHAKETGKELPAAPIVFLKLPSSAAPPNDDLTIPSVIRRLDYEGELAVVMGPDRTVAGYAVADDVSARDLQKREPQWTRAKGFDNSCPYGPWITTADEIEDPHALGLRTWVNGDLRQDSSTADLIFGVPEIIAFLSEAVTLEPGDLILTGTPSGVGTGQSPPQFLTSGDTIRIEIDRLGAIEHAIA